MGIKRKESISSNTTHKDEDIHTIVSEKVTTEASKSSSIKPERVVDSKIKRTILLTLIVICVFFALFPNAGLGPVLGLVANDFNDIKNMSWHIAIFQLLGVRISDCLGRRRVILISTCLGIIITLICGLSINSTMFIVCRLIQGIIMGLITSVISASLVDLFDMKERLKYQPLINISFGVCFMIGPVLGSLFADRLSWKYIFWISAIFFAPVSIGFYYLLDIPLEPEQSLSKENVKTLLDRIDPIGCLIITVGMGLFLTGMHLGSASNSYTWSSPLVIGILVGSVISFFIFVAFEKLITPRPLFPSPVVLDIHLLLCYIQQFNSGWQFILIDILIFVQYQAVDNLSPTEAAMKLLPASILHVVSTICSGKLSYKFENPKAVTIIGDIITVTSITLLLFVQKIDSSITVQVTIITIYQIGLGLSSVSCTLCYQMILEKKAPELVAISTSLARCFNRCGATIATAFVLSLLHSQTTDNLNALQISQPDIYRDIMTYNAGYNYIKIKDIPSGPVKQALNSMYYENIRNIVYAFLIWNIISLLSAMFAKIPSISKNVSDEKPENQ